MINIGVFIDRYTVKYGEFPADPKNEVQIEEWCRVLRLIPEGQLDVVFSNVNEILGKSTKKPRTREFENALRRLAVAPEAKPKGFCGDVCGMCYGSGLITVWVSYMPDNAKRLGFHEGGRPYEVGIPCKCSKGLYLQRNYYQKVSESVQERAYQWLKEQGDIAQSKSVPLLKYLHQQARKYLVVAPLKRRGAGMEWLNDIMSSRKAAADVVRSGGQRAKLSRAADSGGDRQLPVRDSDDPIFEALPSE